MGNHQSVLVKMRSISALALVSLAVVASGQPLTDDVGVPLLLTPYIESNRLDDAREASKVSYGPLNDIAPSHTGFITVNKEHNSNIYFWYVPAKTNAEKAPVVLWLQGGPGGSSLFGLFVENGPYSVDASADLHERDVAWTHDFNMLYIDQPVGTGYSFTGDDAGFATNEDEVARDLHETLRQFYLIFPELLNNDFYITGESYAGKYIPSLGYEIHTKNQESDSVRIPLKGMAIGDGLVDPIHQWFYGEFLYQNGFIDEMDKEELNDMSDEAVKLLQEGTQESNLKATLLFNQMMALFQERTGLNDPFNFNNDIQPVDFNYYQDFLDKPEVRKSIHVGNLTYHNVSMDAYKHLFMDFAFSVADKVAVLLDNDYKMMIYNGQVDVIVTHPGTEKFIRNMNWKDKDQYNVAGRDIWRVEGRVAGYVREVGTLKRVVVRKAGHILSYDQPQTACDMITRFIQDISFTGKENSIAASHCLQKK